MLSRRVSRLRSRPNESSPGKDSRLCGGAHRRWGLLALNIPVSCGVQLYGDTISSLRPCFLLVNPCGQGNAFRFSLRTISFSPDQVSSIAHTFTSTNPRGSATARTTSSVMSVETLDDLFGQETQTVPVCAIFSRKMGNFFSKSPRLLMKTWTKLDSGFRRSEKVTPSGIGPSNRR